MGMGVGFIARMAYDSVRDNDLSLIDIDHLVEPSTAKIVFHKNFFFRKYVLDFICMLAPNLDSELLQKVMRCRSDSEINALIPPNYLPER